MSKKLAGATVLVTTLLLLAGCTQEPASPSSTTWEIPDQLPSSEGPRFVEMAASLGINHYIGPDDELGEGQLPMFDLMMSMEGTVAIADTDNDGAMDILVLDNTGAKLYQNQGGTFVDATGSAGLPTGFNGRSAIFFDYDGDGDQDLFIGVIKGKSMFYRNDGGTFTDISAAVGLNFDAAVQGACAGDVDKDGDVDLFVVNYQRWWESDEEIAGYVQVGPAGHHLMFIQQHDGTFVEESAKRGLDKDYSTLACGFADFDRDGDLDLALSNDFGDQDELYINDGQGNFIEQSAPRGIQQFGSGMGVTWADFNQDGWLDLYLSDISEDTKLHGQPGNPLFVNEGDGTFADHRYLSGAVYGLWSWGGAAFDMENDGDVDLFVANGFHGAVPIIEEPHLNAPLEDPSLGAPPHMPPMHGEFPNFPVPGQMDLPDVLPAGSVRGWEQPNRMYVNAGPARFIDMAEETGLGAGINGRGVAMVDLEGDGDIDLVHAAYGSPLQVYVNQGVIGNYIQMDLTADAPNLDAIGAQVYAYVGDSLHVGHRTAGTGYQSQGWPIVHIGLGETEVIDILHVVWPDGSQQSFADVPANQRYTLVQGGELS